MTMFEYYYVGDKGNERFLNLLVKERKTDHLETAWKKYFNTEPSEFQLRYLSRQQGKTMAILRVAILTVNGVLDGNSHVCLITADSTMGMRYVDDIMEIIGEMDKENRFDVVKRTRYSVEFKNGGTITFSREHPPKGLPKNTNIIFMDY